MYNTMIKLNKTTFMGVSMALIIWIISSCSSTPQSDTVSLQDYGAEPTTLDIDAYTLSNSNFRTALWTGINLQTTLMSIPVGGDVGLENILIPTNFYASKKEQPKC